MRLLKPGTLLVVACFHITCLFAQTKLTIELNKSTKNVSPNLYGLMTEEINYSYDGGLYAELIHNRVFRDNSKTPDHWALLSDGNAKGTIALDNQKPVNAQLPVSLRLDIENAGQRIGISNDGYWGIPVKPATTYQGSLYVRSSGNTVVPLQIGIESTDGKTSYAQTTVNGITNEWKQYHFTLNTSAAITPAADTRFVITAGSAGSYWFNLVSLFPPTYHNRQNGNRIDIMQLLKDMKPTFLRFPGGNYLEGDMFSSRFDWKKTLGPLEKRPGHHSPWKYRSTDGMGLLEFLEWCEDLKIKPLLAIFAGYTLNKDYFDSGALLKPFVNEALEEIEYVIGDTNTKWGARRKQDGHPQPFQLTYVEIGNEDGFDLSGSYERRYLQFYDAIRAKYPHLQIICTVGGKDPLGQRVKVPERGLNMVDEHYYRTASEMEEHASQYDSYDRKGPKVFVGEWATREGFPTTNLNAALGDAAWMTGMEKNSDHIIMSCYAPLFVNVNPGGMQWKSDLIGYDALNSYGSPSYYAQKMFSTYLGDKIVPVTADNVPTQLTKLTARDSAARVTQKTIPAIFYVVTRNSKTGQLFIKLVNVLPAAQTVSFDIKGANMVNANGVLVTLKSDKPEDTNSISDPKKIIPVQTRLTGAGKSFLQTLPANSITIIELETK